MAKRKTRILMDNEFSQYATGYSVYGKEVLSRLYATGKYEIAEFASYGGSKDHRMNLVPWSYYGNQPDENGPEKQEYESVYDNRFGRYRFEYAVLDFKPDVVFAIRDPWMDRHIYDSPLRPYFKLATMPTVDSMPLEDQWISWYMDADAIFTYSDWAASVLEHQGGDAIMRKYLGTASPAANLDIFKPYSREGSREALGMDKDAIIIGTVMRNQRRKLYPDLFIAFRNLLRKLVSEGKHHIADKTFLHIHCAYPDLGWEIPKLIKENGLSQKVIMTYMCNNSNCRAVFTSKHQDVCTMCPKCNSLSAQNPGTANGVDPMILAHIMSSFDVYVQYAICEGYGMPIVEAAACGVPTVVVDYSAMEDFKNTLKSVPIKVARMFLEPDTNAYRAYPDNDQLVDELYKLVSLSKDKRDKLRKSAYSNTLRHYNWDSTTTQWMKYFDSVNNVETEQMWNRPPQIFQPNPNLNADITNGEFVRWAYVNILGKPERCYSYESMRHLKDLNYGVKNNVPQGVTYNENSISGHNKNLTGFTRNDLVNELAQIRNNINQWEAYRTGMQPLPYTEMLRWRKKVG